VYYLIQNIFSILEKEYDSQLQTSTGLQKILQPKMFL
jgi:hypothetical protein